MTTTLLIAVLAALALALVLLWHRYRAFVTRYAPIIDVHRELERAKDETTRLRSAALTEVADLRARTKTEMDDLRSATMAELAEQKRQKEILSQEYLVSRSLYDRLKKELAGLEENLEAVSVGLYKPHYKYDSSEAYRKGLEAIRDRQKALVRDGKAAVCGQTWQVHGDKRAGERMTKQYLKLILRAFNGECDAAVARVSWNNVLKMEERIRRTYDATNDLGGVMQMRLTPEYLELKLAELRLEFEADEKKHQEQEEQRRIKEQMREEERALREAEKARQEAEEEEARNQKALEKAKAELAKAKGEALETLQLRIQQLDAALHESQARKEKANSMAQLTRSGYVYVISNVGSFGENIFKIGMTRRLEPLDRIKELGDASVPFDFDVHALVYSVDAPTLEAELQSRFELASVNLVNPRKEFFAVSIDEIDAFAKDKGLRVEVTRLAEAREYRETLARRAERASAPAVEAAPEEFPAAL